MLPMIRTKKRFMKYLKLLLLGTLSSLGSFANSKHVDINYGNGCKLVYISENNENKQILCRYLIDYSIYQFGSLESYKQQLRENILQILQSEEELFHKLIRDGYTLIYVYQSSKLSPDSPWEVTFHIDKADLLKEHIYQSL